MRIVEHIIASVIFGLFLTTVSFADNQIAATNSQPVFVDRDGDGFNDATVDQNGDGIPDDLSTPVTSPADGSTGTEFTFAVPLASVSALPVFLHNSMAFDFFKSQLVSLSQHRGAFSTASDFGPGSDIGSGAVLGGGCIGGVCSPH